MLLAGAFLAGLVAGGWGTYRIVQGGEVRALSATVRSLNVQAAEREARLSEIELARQEATDKSNRWRNQYYREKRTNEEFATWADAPMPAAAADLLCQFARCLPSTRTPPSP